jgi:transposase
MPLFGAVRVGAGLFNGHAFLPGSDRRFVVRDLRSWRRWAGAKPHPEQGFRACLGILRLARSYASVRIEAACQRGNDIGATIYGSIKSILQHGLDRAYANERPPDGLPIRHSNIRGTGYYH